VAVRDLDLEIGDGESLVLLGQSGCGKTSTMRCIAGLEKPTFGRIKMGDDVLFDADLGTDKPPNKRNIGMVFQSYAIWPHMTVFENVAFSLTMKRKSKEEIRTRVMETLELVGLEGFASALPSRGAWQCSRPSCSSTSHCRTSTRGSEPGCVPTFESSSSDSV
jgi:iron(III) transport system ATP-binding protein